MMIALIRMEVLVLNRLPTALLAFALLAFMQVPSSAAGATLTLQVRPHTGAESLDISGTAPAGDTIDLVLYGTVSADLPVIRLNHLSAQAGPSGTYSLTVAIAPNFVRGSILTITASTPDGASAVARTTIQGPGSETIPAMDSIPSTPF
jgi:hypothetical protein